MPRKPLAPQLGARSRLAARAEAGKQSGSCSLRHGARRGPLLQNAGKRIQPAPASPSDASFGRRMSRVRTGISLYPRQDGDVLSGSGAAALARCVWPWLERGEEEEQLLSASA